MTVCSTETATPGVKECEKGRGFRGQYWPERGDPSMIIETDQAPAAAARQYAAACQIATSLQNDAPLPRSLAPEAMTAASGSRSADGTWKQRDSFVAIHVGTVPALRPMMLPELPKGIVEKPQKIKRK